MNKTAVWIGVSIVLAACAWLSIQSETRALAALPQSVVLDPPISSMRFDPPGPSVPQLSASEALSDFEQVDPLFALPEDATIQFGLYTAAVGDGTFRYLEEPAWGIRFHECAVPQDGRAFDAPLPCTVWLFIDSTTGQMMEATWQLDA